MERGWRIHKVVAVQEYIAFRNIYLLINGFICFFLLDLQYLFLLPVIKNIFEKAILHGGDMKFLFYLHIIALHRQSKRKTIFVIKTGFECFAIEDSIFLGWPEPLVG